MSLPCPFAPQSGDTVTTRSRSGVSPLREVVTAIGCRSGDTPHEYWLVTVSPLRSAQEQETEAACE